MKRRGFTLVEILVVIGILGLLMAILLPVLGAVRASGRKVVCVSNLRQLGQAMKLYTQDYDAYPRGLDPADKYTPQIWAGWPGGATIMAQTPILTEVMQPYVKDNRLWQCPSDTGFDICDSTGLPLNARPTCYKAFGMSYFYRTELMLLDLIEDSLEKPAETHVLCDADGGWHGGGVGSFGQKKRYSMLYADGHAKNVSQADYDAAWAIRLR